MPTIPHHGRNDFARFAANLQAHTRATMTHPGVIDALPYTSPTSLSDPLARSYAHAALLSWREILKNKHASSLRSFDSPTWLAMFTDLSDKDIRDLFYKENAGAGFFRKLRKIGATDAPSVDKVNTLDVLKQFTTPSNSVPITAKLLTCINRQTDYLSPDPANALQALNSPFWQAFGLQIARTYAENQGAMQRGVATPAEEQKRQGYELLARVLVRFAGFKKAPTADALGVSRQWLEKLEG